MIALIKKNENLLIRTFVKSPNIRKFERAKVTRSTVYNTCGMPDNFNIVSGVGHRLCVYHILTHHYIKYMWDAR